MRLTQTSAFPSSPASWQEVWEALMDRLLGGQGGVCALECLCLCYAHSPKSFWIPFYG